MTDAQQPPNAWTAPAARRSIDSATLAALRPHVIDLWGGRFSQDGIYKTEPRDIDRIFDVELPNRLKRLGSDEVLPIVLYAHGGLVSEEAGLQIAANQVAWWNANGCYPIQFVWETGLFEEIERLLGLQRAVARDITDVPDALVEAAVRNLGGPSIWGGMKYAASSAFEAGAAGTAVAARLVAFAKANRSQVALHAVGHSTGSIFHAHLLRQLDALDAPALATLSFLAPAITVADYERLADPLVPARAKRVRIFTMSKDFERADTVTFAYHKSLLYLIYHALEPRPEEPVLGLQESLLADASLVERFGLADTPSDVGEVVWSQTAATSGAHASRSTSHGGFDNDVSTMNSVLRGILGIADDVPLVQSFPPDTETRAAAAPAAPALVTQTPAPPLPPAAAVSGSGSLKALCIGINEYPEGYKLRGCVADTQAWQAALTTMGFVVDTLFDAAATKANVMSRLRTMLQFSRPGDVLVVQYSGHGTEWAPGKVATCPVDFADGKLLTDDEIRAIYDTLPVGVRLTSFMDNCYSYSITRFAGYHPPPPAPDQLARFVTLTDAMIARFDAEQPGARAAALSATRDINRPQSALRWVTFSACDSSEVAYETRGRGDFSNIAVPLLAKTGLTNKQFQDEVVSRFGPQPRQHPRLDCAPGSLDAPFFTRTQVAGRGSEPSLGFEAGDRTRAADVADLLEAIAKAIR